LRSKNIRHDHCEFESLFHGYDFERFGTDKGNLFLTVARACACNRVGMAPSRYGEESRACGAEDHGYDRDGYET
jgi:hypothetical protein